MSHAGALLGLSGAAPSGRGGRGSRVRGRRRGKPNAVDDEDKEDEDEDDDVEPGYVRAVVDGWLTLRLPERALSPLLCLRGRLTACFAAKARPRTPCASTHPARAARALGGPRASHTAVWMCHTGRPPARLGSSCAPACRLGVACARMRVALQQLCPGTACC